MQPEPMIYEEFIERYQYNVRTDLIGEGGFGKVYKAYDNILDRTVAIKVSEVKQGFEAQRLRRELEIVSTIPAHPNIARYEECMTFQTTLGEFDFGILQYYAEGNLLNFIKNEDLTDIQLKNLIEGLLNGIQFLHANNIVHRDLKPQNILIVKRNNVIVPKITDFGISKHYTPDDYSAILNSLMGGTLAYSSPELIKGHKYIHANSDLWSFGVIVYQLCTGELPFNCGEYETGSERGRGEMARQIVDGEIPENLGSISKPYGELVSKCLVVDHEKRIKTAIDCLSLLKTAVVAQKQPGTEPEKPPPHPAPQQPGQKPDGKAPEQDYGGGTKTISDDPCIILPEPATPIELPEKKPLDSLFTGETMLILEKPASQQPVTSEKPDKPAEKSITGFSGETKPMKAPLLLQTSDPLGSPPLDPPAEPGLTAIKTDPGHSWLGWIIAATVIVGFALTFVWWHNRGPSAYEIEEQRIADSIRVADSLAMVQAEQQRIADSIAKVQYEKKISDSINSANSQTQKTKQPGKTAVAVNEEETKKPSVPAPEIEMVYVQGGMFRMGSNNGSNDEKPVHTVTVEGYYIGKYEVTQKQWREVMGNNPSYFAGCDNCPVESVSWNDVQEFIKKLNDKSGKNYRLPTEAEWEYAARGGVKSNGYTYSGSNTFGDVAWYSSNSSNTKQVGRQAPNELGIYDMSGNVWEWCADWYATHYYANSPENNPKNTTKCSYRVCRGGSWNYLPAYCRVALRNSFSPNYRYNFLGFRLLRME